MKKIGIKRIVKVVLFLFIVLASCKAGAYTASNKAYEKLKIMVDVMELINSHYVDEKDDKDMAAGAIRGVVSTLDPFSQYMEEKAYKEVKSETEGAFSGIGIQIESKNGYITVVSPIPDTPAYKAGILPGDKIFKIDGKDAVKMTQEEAVGMMKGRLGTKVTVTMLRDGTPDPIDFVLKRDKIKIVSVRTVIIENDVIYTRLSEFNAQSAKDIEKEIEDNIKKIEKDGGKPKGIVLDLRNNPGGLLDSAIDIISLFTKEKTTALTTRGRNKSLLQEYFTSGDGKYTDIPLIILLNRGSASASEIVSGALQDFKRALIIGANSFGKGSVQTIFPLSDGTALRLTIAKYYLPSGRPITRGEGPNDRNGITPDLEIKLPIEDEIRLYMQSNIIFVDEKKAKVEIIGKAQADKEKAAAATNKTTTTVAAARDPNKVEIIKIEDEVLRKAVDIIKDGRVKTLITSSKAMDKDKEAEKLEAAQAAQAAKEAKEAQDAKPKTDNKLDTEQINRNENPQTPKKSK